MRLICRKCDFECRRDSGNGSGNIVFDIFVFENLMEMLEKEESVLFR